MILAAIVVIIFILLLLLQLWFVYTKHNEKKSANRTNIETIQLGSVNRTRLSVESNSLNNDECAKNIHENVEILSNEDTLEDTNSKNVQVREPVIVNEESEEKQIHEAYSPRSSTCMEISNDEEEPFLPVHPD